jgi:type II secretory pathway pseudopilin PulG
MNKKGKSFVTIMVVIALLALTLRIVVDAIMSRSMSQNQSNAEDTLKLISAALENFARDNRGAYPANFSDLTKMSPPYLDKNYVVNSPVKGYSYSCSRLEPSGYSCSAQPVKCNMSGLLNYNVTTGGVFVAEECRKVD